MGENNVGVAETMLVIANTKVCKSPAKLFDVTLSGDGQDCDCQVYDGENTNGREITHLEVKSGYVARFNPGVAVRVNNGIFVAVNRAEAHVTITFRPLERHE